MKWYLGVWKKYAVFSGRARRREFWLFALFNTLISMVLIALDVATGTFSEDTGLGVLSGIYSLAILIPNLAVSVRRLHDTGRSGWWILLFLIPCLGPLILLVFLVGDSQPGSNPYGPSPKDPPV